MFGKRILPLALMALLVIGLLNVIGSSSYRAGWSQGYAVGQAATSGEEGAPAATYGPYGRDGHFGPGWGFSPFWGIGLFFKFFLFLFVLGAIGRLFFFHRHGPWGKHEHWRHGHKPPGAWDQDDADEPVMKA